MTNQLEALISRAKHIIENGGLLARDTSLALIAALEREVSMREQNPSIKLHMSNRIAELESNGWVRGIEESLIASSDLLQARESELEVANKHIAELEASKLAVKPFAWVSVKNELPDPQSDKRVCAYTPSEHRDLMYRSLPASLFKAVCTDATHWCYFTTPVTGQGEE